MVKGTGRKSKEKDKNMKKERQVEKKNTEE
jgi:hypothetical protein